MWRGGVHDAAAGCRDPRAQGGGPDEFLQHPGLGKGIVIELEQKIGGGIGRHGGAVQSVTKAQIGA